VPEANELRPVEVAAFFTAYPEATYQWMIDGKAVPGATDWKFGITPEARLDGVDIRCVATNSAGSATSPPVALRVVRDTVGPAATRVVMETRTRLRVRFSEPVRPGSSEHGAENASNYGLSGGLRVRRATMASDSNDVVLDVDEIAPRTRYRLTVRNVQDRSVSRNTVDSETALPFSLDLSFRYLRLEMVKTIKGKTSTIRSLRFVGGANAREPQPVAAFPEAALQITTSEGGRHGLRVGQSLTLDYGAHGALRPSALKIRFDRHGYRGADAIRVAGSQDNERWVTLLDHAKRLEGGNAYHTIPIDVSRLEPAAILGGERGE
jgi:hypothetical protein